MIINILLMGFFFLSTQHTIHPSSTVCDFEGNADLSPTIACNYTIRAGTKYVIINMVCIEGKQTTNYTLIPLIIPPQNHLEIDQHLYYLTSQNITSDPHLQGNNNYISSSVDVGLNWQYSIKMDTDGGSVLLKGSKTEYKYLILVILGVYSILACISLPTKGIFYKYMEGVPGFSMMVSIQLTFTLIIIDLISFIKYLNYGSYLSVINIIMMVSLLLHFGYKVKVYRNIIKGYRIATNTKIILSLVSVVYLVGVLLGLGYARKSWITYGYFAFGLIYYMISSLLLNTMKKYGFSFRMILFDSCSIVALSLCNKYYPSFNYEIPTYYQLMSVNLMVLVLILSGGLMFIMVKVMKADIEDKPMRVSVDMRGSRKVVLEEEEDRNNTESIDSEVVLR